MKLGKSKNNQAKSFFSYKNDDVELVDIGQFLRDTTNYRVEREWYILFNKMTGEYVSYQETFNGNIKYKPRNPDLILIDKKTNKIVLIIEIDGGVHDKKFADTEERNEEYIMARLPLLTINKLEIETTIFDLVDRKIREYLE
jgi:very-short-patch-repair endonuclease